VPDRKKSILKQLQEKGVRIPCPDSVEIGEDVSADRISGESVTIHAGCKIYGPKTLIMPATELGYEAPVTVHNCQIGRGVKLKGGYYTESTFLEKASMGSGAQIREACLLEEGARGAHSVGLKHTILFPFVTLGSLINFCDCLMAGGTDPKNHSEVGSSYIHFNFTPNQDKATPSLIGDVPGGVMLNQPPIFLGGQGGMVGPVKVAYGTIVTAGTIVRKDVRESNTMLISHLTISKSIPFHPGYYASIKRIINLNTNYISNLIALRRWYLDVRSMFIENESMAEALHQSAVEKLDMAIGERVKRLGEVAAGMPRSIEIYRSIAGDRVSEKTIRNKQEFFERWEDLEAAFRENLEREGKSSLKNEFLKGIEKTMTRQGKDYLAVIRNLNGETCNKGASWLQGLVDDINKRVWSMLPGLGIK